MLVLSVGCSTVPSGATLLTVRVALKSASTKSDPVRFWMVNARVMTNPDLSAPSSPTRPTASAGRQLPDGLRMLNPPSLTATVNRSAPE